MRRVPARLLGRLVRGCLLALPLWGAAAAVHARPACPPAAQAVDAQALQEIARTAQDRGLLWRLTQGGRTSWLYGTLHVGQRGWVVPGPTVRDALRGADVLALELNLLDPAVAQALAQAMRAQPGAPPLPADVARRLAAQTQAACVDDSVNALRPDAQAMTLAALAGRHQGFDPAYGIDAWLAVLASSIGKPVVGLETPAQQMRELLSDDPVQVADTVRSALEPLERGEVGPQVAMLADVWAQGRLQKLQTYPDWCQCMDTADERALYQRLVDGRNPGLARGIAAEHQGGRSVFAAVGALHMVGPQGLPALLAEQGFRVERVSFPPAARATGPAAQSRPKPQPLPPSKTPATQ
ncbi:MAG: TraB/GumN family protein [Comamonadaceae bacterium]|nr:MAG: TraB/GumN family protein [Comamonadaceae bacterium]